MGLMPLWTPPALDRIGPQGANEDVLDVVATPSCYAGPSHASDATQFGTITELIASTPFDAYWVEIVCFRTPGSDLGAHRTMYEILIGPNGTEQVLIPKLICHQTGWSAFSNKLGPIRYAFPLFIPKGSRLSSHVASTDASNTTCQVLISLFGAPYARSCWGSRVEAIGAGTTPAGTAVTPGENQTPGSWSALTTNSANEYIALMPGWANYVASSLGRTFTFDVGVGTNQQIVGQYGYFSDANEGCAGPHNNIPIIGRIPAGPTLSVRLTNNSTNLGTYDCMLYGVIA